MKPKKIWSNLGVKDLKRTTKFYNDLGFKSNGKSEQLTSFFVGGDDFIMHFFLNDILKDSMKGKLIDLEKGNEVLYTLSAETRDEVDKWAAEVENAGGTLVSQPEEFGKNGEKYYGFVFADPDGHRFNVFQM